MPLSLWIDGVQGFTLFIKAKVLGSGCIYVFRRS